jgi:hypothetical protein
MNPKLEGFPFYLVVDFGYSRIRVMPPKKIVFQEDGKDLIDFLRKR